jgi:hypothetical protein
LSKHLEHKALLEEFFQELIDQGLIAVDVDGEIDYSMSKDEVSAVVDLISDLAIDLSG